MFRNEPRRREVRSGVCGTSGAPTEVRRNCELVGRCNHTMKSIVVRNRSGVHQSDTQECSPDPELRGGV
jgi:hypothetical protein